jgi:type IV pilus assembly protein PilB
MGKLDTAQLQGRRLGRVLTKMGKVSREQIQEAMEVQRNQGGPIGQILVELGYISEEDLTLAMAAKIGMPLIDLDRVEIGSEVTVQVAAQTARTYRFMPFEFDESTNTLNVALSSPDNFAATDDLRTLMGFNVKPYITDEEQLEAAIEKYYPEDSDTDILGLIDEIEHDAFMARFEGRGESIDLDDLRQLTDSNPLKKLVNLVLLQAIRDNASDIHFEPFEDEYKMRYRIDGVLYEMVPPPRHVAIAISSRVKVMAALDISERRLPQDGRIELTVNNQPVDLRVSCLPTMFGESVVLRVLNRAAVSLDLDNLGIRYDDLDMLRQLIHKPHGIVICTGPTGAGKTTTLYSALRELNQISEKIITTEDPVEYDLDGIVQCQINTGVGLTFARCLRSILRQDPDIILVGEIRDLETAEIAIQASLTGHLVFTTLHTNDAPSAVARLVDLGVEAFMITATVEGIVGQRLLRKICENCKEEFTPTEEMLRDLEISAEDAANRSFFAGHGCDLCNHTGYRGRMAIYEILIFDEELRGMVVGNVSTNILRREARQRGMRTLRESGLLAIDEGLTTIDEVVKQTVAES